MTEDFDTAKFYDNMGDGYHGIFHDWDASIKRQAEVLGGLFVSHSKPVHSVLDASCGIGTQCLALHTKAILLQQVTLVADLCNLNGFGEHFDAVISCDNALPHLLTDNELFLACQSLRKTCVDGGLCIISIRDYDKLLLEKPSGELPRSYRDQEGERVVFQLWEWEDDIYSIRHFILTDNGDGFTTDTQRGRYRALTRSAITQAMNESGFQHTTWKMPQETGYYQPILCAS